MHHGRDILAIVGWCVVLYWGWDVLAWGMQQAGIPFDPTWPGRLSEVNPAAVAWMSLRWLSRLAACFSTALLGLSLVLRLGIWLWSRRQGLSMIVATGWVLWMGIQLDACRGSGACTAMETTWRVVASFQTEEACRKNVKWLREMQAHGVFQCRPSGDTP